MTRLSPGAGAPAPWGAVGAGSSSFFPEPEPASLPLSPPSFAALDSALSPAPPAGSLVLSAEAEADAPDPEAPVSFSLLRVRRAMESCVVLFPAKTGRLVRVKQYEYHLKIRFPLC